LPLSEKQGVGSSILPLATKMKLLISKLIQVLVNSKIFIIFLSRINSLGKLSKYNKSAPRAFKQKLFLKYNSSQGAWIETGTYLGETTKYLSQIAKYVYSIEPSKKYYDDAKEKFSKEKNIILIQGTSEDCLEEVISKTNVESVSFWLDGHYSRGDTFEGKNHSPVLIELEIIEKYMVNFKNVNVLIDDFRIFNKHYPKSHKVKYPTQSELINWVKDRKLKWKVKKNIFIINWINQA